LIAAAADPSDMSEDCIFCKIVDGEIPSHTVGENDSAYAFLDVNPLARGHTVVIPKEHHEHVGDMPGEVAGELFQLVNELTPAVQAAAGATGSTIGFNNGEDAGQEVPHAHCHIVPRTPGDGGGTIHTLFSIQDIDDDEMGDIAESIRNAR
jgi:histidine triad (HIT) family protein